MKHRLLGAHTGLRVSALALGTGRLGLQSGRESDPGQARAVLHAFAEAGGNFLDTSSAYQLGRSEEMIGSFLAEVKRDDFVIASKYSRTTSEKPSPAVAGNHRKAMRAEVEASLRRLGTDHLDVYFVHYDDGVTPVEEIMRGFDDLVRTGKVIYPGLSNFSAWRMASAATLAELRGWAPLAVMQMQYNLLARDLEREHVPFSDARGVGRMAYSPLAGGRLSKSVAEGATDGERAIHRVLTDVATALGCAESSVALAWVMTRGWVPVIGSRTVEQLAGNLAAVGLELSADQVTMLNDASERPLGDLHDLLEKMRDGSGTGRSLYRQSGSVL